LPSNDPGSGVVAIRDALTPVDDLLNEITGDEELIDIEHARRVVQYGWG
jgi:hypothetical protein